MLVCHCMSTAHNHTRMIKPYHRQMHTSLLKSYANLFSSHIYKINQNTNLQHTSNIAPSELLLSPQKAYKADILVSMTISFCRHQIKEKYETQRIKWSETSDMLTGCKHHLFLCIIHCTCHASVDTRHSHTQAQDKIVKNMPTMSVTTFHSP